MDKISINPNRIDLDEAYMQMAEVWGRRSKANRLQVGCLIVKDRQVISDGYNGMPSGASDDVCETLNADGTLSTKREVLHAESNALMKISENGGVGAQGATLYTTWSPCFECAKLIRQSKVSRVVFRNAYRDGSGIDFLQQMGIQVEQLDKLKAAAPVDIPAQVEPSQQVEPLIPFLTTPQPSLAQSIRAAAGAPVPEAPPRESLLKQVTAPSSAPITAKPAATSMSENDAVAQALAEFEAYQLQQAGLAPPAPKQQETNDQKPQKDGGYVSPFL